MQRRRAVLVQLLDFRDDQVALGEEASDLQLVCFSALAENAAGEIDGADLEDGELGGGYVDAPSFGLDFGDAPDDEVADFRGVAGAEGMHGEEFVGFGEGSREGGGDGLGGSWEVSTVATWDFVSLLLLGKIVVLAIKMKGSGIDCVSWGR